MAIEFDTIAAISTPPGEGGIGIVRISGDEALEIADRVYQAGKKELSSQKTHTIHYGHIVNPKTDTQIDEVMVTVMRAPKTYTREDVVEINTHGGIVSVNKVLETVLHNGARLAEPGEFTKRAFLNGRIDLSQAEAVMDVIRAKTDKAMHMAVTQLDGNLSRLIKNLRQEILGTLAQVEVNIDYPEYDDVEEMTSRLLVEKAKEVKAQVEALLETAGQGKILREGLATAIIGRPNVGKSSLLNVLLKEEKAIVTEVAGTTRDVIEEYVSVKGVPLRLIDTAGIRETEDIVERIGVERSRKALSDADLILLVFNQSEPLTEEDKLLLEATDGHHRIIILNKMDLENRLDFDELKTYVDADSIVQTSIVTEAGLTELEAKIAELFFAGNTGEKDATYVSNIRHIALLNETIGTFDDVIEGIEMGMPVDLVQIDMTRAWDLLGEITGDSVQDELITQLFSQFCLGK
ncbi:tRNA modification GTPase [Alkalibacterium putridalgicola]|uniref:tRNA modification GTPase MnmE n=1 Tax=Alkalibacterium putridalgicola TaxID=426703 RepID=A0A1H7RIX9_9LACT|nr:tRNA uridine-5-carboxymethylaminomethyl(34) synthesis GTPase MnmE [Alkalibacterium putridalgicola]GEK88870.1 tRNA modification GTPase MnmE [Alkalibacterium putridalgicola]SEL60211.1 tRNA modification GTPase [Alkalibacterium putridalgicola]